MHLYTKHGSAMILPQDQKNQRLDGGIMTGCFIDN